MFKPKLNLISTIALASLTTVYSSGLTYDLSADPNTDGEYTLDISTGILSWSVAGSKINDVLDELAAKVGTPKNQPYTKINLIPRFYIPKVTGNYENRNLLVHRYYAGGNKTDLSNKIGTLLDHAFWRPSDPDAIREYKFLPFTRDMIQGHAFFMRTFDAYSFMASFRATKTTYRYTSDESKLGAILNEWNRQIEEDDSYPDRAKPIIYSAQRLGFTHIWGIGPDKGPTRTYTSWQNRNLLSVEDATIINGGGGFGTGGISAIIKFTTKVDPATPMSVPFVFDSLTLHSSEVTLDLALTPERHVEQFLFVNKAYEDMPEAARLLDDANPFKRVGFNNYKTHINSRKANGHDTYGTKIIYKDVGYAQYISVGKMQRLFPTVNPLTFPNEPESGYNVDYYKVQEVLRPISIADPGEHVSEVGIKIEAKKAVTIPIQDHPIFLFFSMKKIIENPNLNKYNYPDLISEAEHLESTFQLWASRAIVHNSKTIIPLNMTRFQWLRDNSQLNWDEEPITVYLSSEEPGDEAEFRLFIDNDSPTNITLFSVPATVDDINTRSLLLNEASLVIQADPFLNIFPVLSLYGGANAGGTIALINESSLVIDVATILFKINQLALDSTSKLIFSGVALSAHKDQNNSPIVTGKVLILKHTGPAATSTLTHFNQLVRLSSHPQLGATASSLEPRWLASFDTVEVADGYFAEGADYSSSDYKLAYDLDRMPSGFMKVLIPEVSTTATTATATATNFYFYSPFAFKITKADTAEGPLPIAIEGSLFSALSADEWQMLIEHEFPELGKPQILKLGTGYSPNGGVFSIDLVDDAQLPATTMTNVRTIGQMFALNLESVDISERYFTLLQVSHTGRTPDRNPSWTFDLTNLNLINFTAEKSYLGMNANLRDAFRFTTDSETGKVVTNLGMHYGNVSIKSRIATFNITAPIFALPAAYSRFIGVLATADGLGNLQAEDGANIEPLISELFSAMQTGLNDATPALEHEIVVCENQCGITSKVTLVRFAEAATVFGGLLVNGIDEGRVEQSGYVAEIELGSGVGSGSSGPGKRMAILYGGIEFGHIGSYSTANQDEKENLMTVTIKQHPDSADLQVMRELMWLVPAAAENKGAFLNNKVYENTAISAYSHSPIGTLVVDTGVSLLIGSQTAQTQSLGFAKVTVRDNAKLTFRGRLGTGMSNPDNLEIAIGAGPTLTNLEVGSNSEVVIDGVVVNANKLLLGDNSRITFKADSSRQILALGALKVDNLQISETRYTSDLIERIIGFNEPVATFPLNAWSNVIEASSLSVAEQEFTNQHSVFIGVEDVGTQHVLAKKLYFSTGDQKYFFQVGIFEKPADYAVGKVYTGTNTITPLIYTFLPVGSLEVQFLAIDDDPLKVSTWQVYTEEQISEPISVLTNFWTSDGQPTEGEISRARTHVISGTHIFYYGGAFGRNSDVAIGSIGSTASLQFRASPANDLGTDIAFFAISTDHAGDNPEVETINGEEVPIDAKTLFIDVDGDITIGQRVNVATANLLSLDGSIIYELDSAEGLDNIGQFSLRQPISNSNIMLISSVDKFKFVFKDDSDFDFTLFANNQRPFFKFGTAGGEIHFLDVGGQLDRQKIAGKPLEIRQIGSELFLTVTSNITTSTHLSHSLVFLTSGPDEVVEILFEKDAIAPDGMSTWRADSRVVPATVEETPVEFWSFENTASAVVVPLVYTTRVTSGDHQLIHGGSFSPSGDLLIGDGTSHASLQFAALPASIAAGATTYFNAGAIPTPDVISDRHIVINNQGELIVGQAVQITTASQLSISDAGKLVYYVSSEDSRPKPIGKIVVTHSATQTLTLPSLSNFELRVIAGEVWEVNNDFINENPIPLFEYQGSRLTFADALASYDLPMQNLQLLLEGNIVYLTTSGNYILSEDTAEFRKLMTSVSEVIVNATVNSSLMLSDSFKSVGNFSSGLLGSSGRAKRKIQFEVPYPAKEKFWVSAKLMAIGSKTPETESLPGFSSVVTAGYRFSDSYTAQLSVVASGFTVTSEDKTTQARTRELGLTIVNRVNMFSAFGFSVGGGLLVSSYKYKTGQSWLTAETYGKKWMLRTAFDFNYSINRPVAFSHELSWLLVRNEVPELAASIGPDANVKWKNDIQLLNQVATGYKYKRVFINHSFKLGIKASIHSDWSKTTPAIKPHWLSFQAGFTTDVEFGYGFSLGCFIDANYSGFKKDQIFVDYQAGFKLQYSR